MSRLRVLAAKLQQLVDRIDPQAGRYRMLFESSPLPMWVLDDETLRFLAVNDAALRLYGYSREEFLGMSASDLRRADERRDFLRNEPGGSVYRGVFRHARKNGEPLDIDGVGHLVPNGLIFPRHLTHRVADVSAGSLMLFLGRVAKIARRARHPFAELGCRPRREVQRKAGADHAARDDPD